MRKIIISIVILLTFTFSSYAVSYLDGDYYGFCPLVNPSNSSAVTARGFFAYGYDSNNNLVYLVSYNSSYYAVRTFIVGYTTANQVSGTFNDKAIGTATD